MERAMIIGTIKTFEREDGKERLFMVERDDGLFSFYGLSLIDDDDPYGPYWVPNHFSGIYATASDAERAACAEVPWLKRAL
jgi:hypothetical protein